MSFITNNFTNQTASLSQSNNQDGKKHYRYGDNLRPKTAYDKQNVYAD